MLSWMLGIAAFLLFFVYDVNSVTLRAPLLHTGFFLGVLLLLASTGLDLFYPQIGVGKRLDGGRRRVKKYLWSF